MGWREFITDNFSGDLEYHPHRGAVYLLLGAALVTAWYFSLHIAAFAYARVVTGTGALALLIKGIFLLRRSSEGLGISEQELKALAAKRKPLPALPEQAAQLLQDFGAGPMLLSWPLSIIFDAESKAGPTFLSSVCLRPELSYFLLAGRYAS